VVLILEPSGQMLSLNKTNVGNLLRDFGEESDNWIGQLVEIYAGEIGATLMDTCSQCRDTSGPLGAALDQPTDE
jgi:hypothetical protein